MPPTSGVSDIPQSDEPELASATSASTRFAGITRRLGTGTAALACLIAGAYLIFILVPFPATPPDFRYVWTAGRLWLEGLNPYSDDFPKELSVWLYPPHWFPIAVPFARFPYLSSFAVWKALMAALVIGTTITAWWAVSRRTPYWSRTAILWWLAYFMTFTAVGGALRSGQPTIPSYIGLCLIVAGLSADRRILIVAGVFLSLLKPTIGLPFTVLLMLSPRTFAPTMVGIALIGAASLPSLLTDGLRSGFLRTLFDSPTIYQTIDYNTPDVMTGVFHLTSRLVGWASGVPTSGIVAGLAAGLGALCVQRMRVWSGISNPSTMIIIGILTTSFIALLHSYDMMLVALLLPCLPSLSLPWRGVALAGYALLWRPENVARLIDGNPVTISDIQSTGLLLLFGAFTVGLSRLGQRGISSNSNIQNPTGHKQNSKAG